MKSSPDAKLPSRGALLAIDPGVRYIGVAVSDPEQSHVFPQNELEATPHQDLLENIGKLLDEYHITGVLVGYPKSLRDKSLPMTARAEKLAKNIEQQFALPVLLLDERMSSVAAIKIEPGAAKEKRRIDSRAAGLMLESYLEQTAHG